MWEQPRFRFVPVQLFPQMMLKSQTVFLHHILRRKFLCCFHGRSRGNTTRSALVWGFPRRPSACRTSRRISLLTVIHCRNACKHSPSNHAPSSMLQIQENICNNSVTVYSKINSSMAMSTITISRFSVWHAPFSAFSKSFYHSAIWHSYSNSTRC